VRGEMKLNILSATDSVRGRLAWFLYENDFSGMNQAVGVALYNDVDLDLILAWCGRERATHKFAIFRENLEARKAGSHGD